ncbi:Gfo/Idh/MocA family oxidoreductase [Paenibacillus sp. JCM 10914]|uniref:Gfo/Idh/MocA family protein n=1 Tax=Paenibacillus sp. JCM 10914 TaxID=1236974 RepID=UPI0003CCA904|nr:Gfo/Idh/MocA family oxidoreductase [Paenibacillus sp. JCM 10914]GAE09762.1 predicted dehydrogenase and related proteins [Paenibacillus sp. JCM 10914]
MLRVGILGFGFMGRMHFDNYVRLIEEGAEVELVAICDLRIEELKNSTANGNMATERDVYDLTPYRLYDHVDEMLKQEELDIVDVCLPTYLHADMTCMLLEQGIHVMCEKPMAGSTKEAWRMVEAAERTGKTLMIGQCLRFWPAYEYLKACVEDGRYGSVVAGEFYRGSEPPKGWFLEGEKSGGCITDMHVHDVDMIHWLMGKPQQVSTFAKTVIECSSYDVVSTHYRYEDGNVINAHADWTLHGEHGFYMGYRVNLEQATLVFENNELKVYPEDAAGFTAALSEDSGYYRELKYFIESVAQGTPVTVCTPASAAASLEIIEAEIRSANANGALETLPTKQEVS